MVLSGLVRAWFALAILGPAPAFLRAPLGHLVRGDEQVLLERYAPVVHLAPGERALPASVDWFLARAELASASWPESGATQASLLREWQAAGGGVLLQYWFFYPYNDFYRLGDHDGDWEHVTVHLDPSLAPLGAWYAQHDDNAPGEWLPWERIEKEGEHPVVLSARGSHASYADPEQAAWYDETCPTARPPLAPGKGCRVWRTWSAATGGVVETGSRVQPRPPALFVKWPGRWGDASGPRPAPPGPAHQPGWCSQGAPGCS